MRRWWLLLAFVVAACGPLGAAHAQTLSLSFKQGSVYKYSVHVAVAFTIGESGMSMSSSLDVSAKVAATVKSIDSAGAATLSVAVTDLALKTVSMGVTNTTTGQPVPPIEVVVGANGQLKSINGQDISTALGGATGSQGGLWSAILPSGAVSPGDKWSKTINEPGPSGSGSLQLTSKSTYVGNDQVNGTSAAKIESKITGTLSLTLDSSTLGAMGQAVSPNTGLPISGAPSTGSGTDTTMPTITVQGTGSADVLTWIDPSGHRLVKSHSTGKVTATVTISGLDLTQPPLPTNPAPNQGLPSLPSMPNLNGPIQITVTETEDVNPA